MKSKLLWLAGALMLVSTSVSFAGVSLTWGSGCIVDGDVRTKTFACALNTGTNSFVGSFTPSADMSGFVGIEVVLDVQFDGVTTVPAWWDFFNATSCRQTSLSTSADFTTAPGGCVDPWSGLAGGGIAAWQTDVFPPPQGPLPPGRARLKIGYALADSVGLLAGTQYYGFRATFNNLKTTGTPTCAGCLTGATLVLNQIKAAPVYAAPELLTAEDVNRCITWQTSVVTCSSVPANNRTWGQIKSIYR